MHTGIKTALPMIALAALGLVALCSAAGASAAPVASHDAAFFENLLTDRAYVYAQPAISNS